MQRALKLLQTTPGLLVLIALLRSAGFAFGVLNIDESDYMVFGASILRGEIPYRDLGEVKPPLGYYTWVPAGLFGGMQAWPMRVVGVLWILATALLLRDAVRRWTKDELAGTCAAVLSILATLCEVPSLGNEAMMNLPAAAALWCFVRARKSPSRSLASRLFELLAGAAVGVASLYKLQAGIEGAALGIAAIAGAVLYRYNDEIVPVHVSTRGPSAPSFPARLNEGALRGALLSIGFVLPWAIAMGAYAAIGEWSTYVDWVFTRSFAYAGQGATGGGLGRFAQSTLLCVGATIVPWTLAARGSWAAIKSKLADPIALAGVLFVWLTWLPVSAGGRFYEHYYLQFAPALALVGAPWAADLVRRFVRPAGDVGALSRGLKLAIVLGCVLPALGLTGYSWARGLLHQYPAQEPRAIAVGEFIQAHSGPEDRMFVWGHYTPLYVLAQRLPGTRYPNTSVQMGNFDPLHLAADFDPARTTSQRDVELALRDLQTRRPRFVVDTAPADIHGWSKIPLEKFPSLDAFVQQHYALIGTPGGARVYESK